MYIYKVKAHIPISQPAAMDSFPKVNGNQRHIYDDDDHVRACLFAFFKKLQDAVEEFHVMCSTNGAIKYENYDDGYMSESIYSLIGELKCSAFEILFKVRIQDKMDGPFGEEIDIWTNITWLSMTVEESIAGEAKNLDGISEHLLFSPATNVPSITLHTSSARQYQKRVQTSDLYKFEEAADLAVAKLMPMFLFNHTRMD